MKNTIIGYIIVCFYIDDMLILDSNEYMIKSTKKILTNKFDMKDLGVVQVILGIKISKTSNGLVLSQSHYIEKSLEKFSKNDNSTVKTPIDISVYLSNNWGKGIKQLGYSRMIGSFIYIIKCTRPDIAYSVSKLCRFISNPSMDHWKAIKKYSSI